MAKKILIWKDVSKGGDLDIFYNMDYSTICHDVKTRFNDICPNWGNKLWFQGLISAIQSDENILTFRTNENIDFINNNYDLIIYPMANFFGTDYKNNMYSLAETFQQIKIPTYIIACGAQANSYDDLNNLIKDIGEPAKHFISSIYETGGEFALRGHFTKQFFDELGFHSAVVTGCPSMFQLGRDFKITNIKVSEKDFKPCFNGKISLLDSSIEKFDTYYFDQDNYFYKIYDSTYDVKTDYKSLLRYYRHETMYSIKLLAENKIAHIPNLNQWRSFLKNGNFNYSFGSRIHGSIMAILAGVPATVVAVDTRTKEMADFFDIPYIMPKRNVKYSNKDIYQNYLNADFKKFNATFAEKFDFYENFFIQHDIVKSVNQSNEFFKDDVMSTDFLNYSVNTEKFHQLYNKLNKIKPLLAISNNILTLLKRFK